MFGLIKKVVKQINNKITLHILGNNGNMYFYSYTQQNSVRYNNNDRVEFWQLDDKAVSSLKKAGLEKTYGVIIRIIDDYRCFIRTDQGEILEYSESAFPKLSLSQRVYVKPCSPEDNDARWGVACQMELISLENLTPQVKRQISEVLSNSFNKESIHPLAQIIECLTNNGFPAERFGFTNQLHHFPRNTSTISRKIVSNTIYAPSGKEAKVAKNSSLCMR